MKNVFKTLLALTCIITQSSFGMQNTKPSAPEMNADASALLHSMEASSSSSSASTGSYISISIHDDPQDDKEYQEEKDYNKLMLARYIMLQIPGDTKKEFGLPDALFDIVMGYALDGDVIKTITLPDYHMPHKVMSRDGSTIAGINNGKIKHYNILSEKQNSHFAPKAPVTIAISADGTKTFCFGEKSASYFFPRYVRIAIYGEGSKPPSALAFSPSDDKIIAFAKDDCSIGMGGYHPPHIFEGHDSPATALAISASNKRVASATAKNIKIWNVENQKCLITMAHDIGPTKTLAFSPNGRKLASGSDDHKIRVWDSAYGDLLATLEGHTSPINTVSMPDEKTIIALEENGTIKTWQLARNCQEALDIVQKKETFMQELQILQEDAANKERTCIIQ